jgi:hypothetical protein
MKDRKALIRLAAALPVGSDERQAILSGLQKTAGSKRLLVYNTFGVVMMKFMWPLKKSSPRSGIRFEDLAVYAKQMQGAPATVQARIQKTHPKVKLVVGGRDAWMDAIGSEMWMSIYADFDMRGWTQSKEDFSPSDWDELKSLLGKKIDGYAVEVDPKAR